MAHVHISDCDGKVHGDLPPGRGVVDFPPYLEAIKGLGIDDATVSIELEYSPEPDRIVDWVREAYDATAALMARRGCGVSRSGVGRLIRRSVSRLACRWLILRWLILSSAAGWRRC